MRTIASLFIKIAAITTLAFTPLLVTAPPSQAAIPDLPSYEQALELLDGVAIDVHDPMDGYARTEFPHWRAAGNGCDMRQLILNRDMTVTERRGDGCTVLLGTLEDPFTGKTIDFQHTSVGGNSNAVQIDHVVALCDAWKTGAQGWTRETRAAFANDPINLLAVDGPANGSKGCGNAHSWLPRSSGNAAFDCDYVTAQTAVKSKYGLTMAFDEHDLIGEILTDCIGVAEVEPTEPTPDPEPAPEPSPTPEPETTEPVIDTPVTETPHSDDPNTLVSTSSDLWLAGWLIPATLIAAAGYLASNTARKPQKM